MNIFDKKFEVKQYERNIFNIFNNNYDNYLIKKVYEDVIEKLNCINRKPNNILELNIKEDILQSRYKNFTSTSLSSKYKAKNNIIASNELLPFAPNSFDLIVNILDLHKLNDLIGSLIQIKDILKDGSVFIASFFTGGTLFDLRNSLIKAAIKLNIAHAPQIFPFIKSEDLVNIMQRAKFSDFTIDNFKLSFEYDSIFELMHDLRKSGQNNNLFVKARFLPRDLFFKAQNIYSKTINGKIIANFHLSTVTAFK